MYEFFECDFENAVLEWDEEKEARNFLNHGIRFRTAAKVFLDPNKLIRIDEEHTEELRFNILGKVKKVLFVVCVFKENNVIRLISARLASQPEQERYRNGQDEIE